MATDPLYKKVYTAGYWDGVKDAVSGKIRDWQTSDIAKLPVKAMVLSSRATNCLLLCGCTYVGDVIRLSTDQIMRMRNLGPNPIS